MPRILNYYKARYVPAGIFFLGYILYFGLSNGYHITYLEQNQLFLFNIDYLAEFITMPGWLVLYSGNFFTQFFISIWAGTLIITLTGVAFFLVSDYICRKHDLESSLAPLIPVWLLSILQSNELFTFSQSMGFLFLISFFALYISIRSQKSRYMIYFGGWPLLYYFAGAFALPAALLCALHESVFRKSGNFIPVFTFYILTALTIPYLLGFGFYIPPDEIFTYPVNLGLHSLYLLVLVLLFSWFPLLLIAAYLKKNFRIFNADSIFPKKIRLSSEILEVILMFLFIYHYAYNRKAEIMLEMDYHVQRYEWEKVLKLADRYPGYNGLVIYYTNLALYKTGKMSDRMFSYPQSGPDGLRLKWDRNLSSFFGGEIFFHLGYTNEANRWAFESLVAKGLNPRSLKRLAVTSIINGDDAVAAKYLHKLDETLFYKQWADKYSRYIYDPASEKRDPEISENRDLLIKNDFFSNDYHLNLYDLLSNHPENKMVYEYAMASLLLSKDLDNFVKLLSGLKDYGYKKIPVHYEEALVFYNFSQKSNLVPEGFTIQAETIDRFNNYIDIYTGSKGNVVNELKNKFGNTFWYYFQFRNNKK